MFREEWTTEKIVDLPIKIIDGDRSSRYPKRSEFQGDGVPFLNSTSLDQNRLDVAKANFISPQKYAQIKKGRLQPMDIVMTTRGSIGKIALFNDPDYTKGLINAQMLIIRADGQSIDQRFLFYYLCSSAFQDLVHRFASGSAQPQIPIRDLEDIPISFPPVRTQRKIAAILSAYDDLIENNIRRIAILEEMAHLLYREWFVHFRFPGYENVEMVDSELGAIPEGWDVVKVKQIVKRLRPGKRYKQKEVADTGEVPVISQSEDRVRGWHDNEPDHEATPEAPIILFGDHTCKMALMIKPFSIAENVVPFVSKDDAPAIYLYHLTRDLVKTREYKRHWTPLKNKTVIRAPNKYADRFAVTTRPFYEQRDTLLHQNRILAKARDLLLPRLVSGELDVGDLPIDVRSPES